LVHSRSQGRRGSPGGRAVDPVTHLATDAYGTLTAVARYGAMAASTRKFSELSPFRCSNTVTSGRAAATRDLYPAIVL
jgi:hypothetical protein